MTEAAGPSNEQHPYHDLIQQFKEICAIDDDTIAAICIQQAEGNLQDAVVRFLSGDSVPEPPPVAHDIPFASNELRRRHVPYDASSGSSSSSLSSSPGVPPRSGNDDSWSAWFSRLLAVPFQYFYFSVRQVFAFVFGLFGGLLPAITSPEEDVQTFKTEIETKYADVEATLNWHHSTYTDVLKEAKSSVRFLLVYLHNPSHQSTESFLREKLCTSDFKTFLDQSGIIIWGTNVKTTEGYKVAQALHEQTYPSLMLICMRDNRLACVLKLSGNSLSKRNLIAALQDGVSQNQRFLNAILNERAQRQLDNELRRQQEAEYAQALQQDREKVAARRRHESEMLEKQQREEEELRQIEAKRQRLSDIRQQIREEVEVLSEPDVDIVRVSVRFPCGSKFDRRYGVNDSLEVLFKTVIAHEKCPEDFSLLSSYPRKELTCAPEWYKEYGTVSDDAGTIQTFKEAGLDSSAVVLVRDNQA